MLACQNFFAVLSCLRNERDHNSLKVMAKKKVMTFQNTDEEQYAQLLIPYAFDVLHEQLDLRKKVKINGSGVLSSEGMLMVTEDKCQCKF